MTSLIGLTGAEPKDTVEKLGLRDRPALRNGGWEAI
jgi:hypothetical protein